MVARINETTRDMKRDAKKNIEEGDSFVLAAFEKGEGRHTLIACCSEVDLMNTIISLTERLMETPHMPYFEFVLKSEINNILGGEE